MKFLISAISLVAMGLSIHNSPETADQSIAVCGAVQFALLLIANRIN